MEFMLQERRGGESVGETVLFAPLGLVRLRPLHPRLTPWAAFFRRFAAGLRGIAVLRLRAALHFAARDCTWSAGAQDSGRFRGLAGTCALGYWCGGEGETDGEFGAAFGLVAAGDLSTVILNHAIDCA